MLTPGDRADGYYDAHRGAIDACLEFRRSARIVLAACDRFLAAFRLTDAAMAVLLELRRTSGATPTALAERVGVRRSSVSVILKRLRRDAWIGYSVDDRDGRRRIARLTRPGRRRLDTLLGSYYRIARAQVAGLSEEERAGLRSLLARLRSGSPPPPRRGRPELGLGLDDPFEEWEREPEED